MFARNKSKEPSSTRKVTPPSPSYMSSEQFAAYLTDLRNNRINRPGGARPQPGSRREVPAPAPASGRSTLGTPPLSETASVHQRTQSDVSSNGAAPATRPSFATSRPSLSASVSSRYSTATHGARDYYPDRPVQPLKPGEVVPTATYIERGQRWMEKEEAVSLRQAMEDMDLKDQGKDAPAEDAEEKRIYEAALDEAAELVWQHQNPGKVPQPGAPYRYKPHMRKNSYAHARTASAGMYGNDVAPTGLARDPSMRSVSGSSSGSDGPGSTRGRSSFASSRQASGARGSSESQRGPLPTSRPAKSYGSISGAPSAAQGSRRRSSLKRNISGEVQKPFSGDQIWEEPNESSPGRPSASVQDSTTQPLRVKPKNPLNRVQFASELHGARPQPTPKLDKYEIYRNPPTQTRNPEYTTTNGADTPPKLDNVPRKHGVEIRSEDIRQATSMKLKDRSSKLPTPSAVSDTPGRPIVSFDKDWRPPEEATDKTPEESRRGRGEAAVPCRIYHQQPQQPAQDNVPSISVTEDSAPSPAPSSRRPWPASTPSSQMNTPPVPAISVSDTTTNKPPIPTISLSDEGTSIPVINLPDDGPSIPTINLPDDGPSIPVIVTPDDTPSAHSTRPLPTPVPSAPRVRHQSRPNPTGHWSPATRPVNTRATARCHECSLPIEGRFVSLAGTAERFHPQCFTCYTCGTSLEALEISPEPDSHRHARLDRIARRAAGEILSEDPGATMAEDGDERLRFYCHLDWHELFAPRCKHCKTPIMGEHVVALGAHWHFGHFFCAECGDPFEKGMTHIEKDGYAWCVGCQTKRTERRAPKCKRCKLAVIGQYVQALGGEWHDECFRCGSCGGGFDDGQIFPREDGRGVWCTGCMERELKA
ncbi:hypothetical protein QBC34DRAFT_446746 [Podospora aff. communis PSN243]|uniref:LIM zinc-binding domain-containing protein n=1 Tax=Podospora aff. communis PSN243 TaxID=3040156 RepID=A0AAV9H0F5_9PEZI|nr:hypothetical protein QBC34DRAFT_446746 [Podospora aff. communis PSN243]